MDFSQFLLALRARRKVFLVVLGATIFTALAIALIVPKNYVSTATVLIDARNEQAMGAGGEHMSPRERTGYLQTQVELIVSSKVAKRVVRDLKITQAPGVREDYERDTGGTGTIEDWAATQLLKKLKADASASNIISIQFSAPDPKQAAAVANAFSKAYVDTALELRTEPSREAAAWFEEQLKSLRQNVAQSQQKLAAYQKEKGIVFTEERTDVEATRLTEIGASLAAARSATFEAQSRYKHAAEFIQGNASAGAGAPDALPEVMANPSVLAIKAALAAAEARLETSTADLGPAHPAYQRNVAEVKGLREQLASEMKKVVNGLNNAAVQSRRREDELKAAYAAQTQQLLANREARVELAVLTRDVENAQRTYDTALSRWLTNKVEARASLTNIAPLSSAVEPLEPKSPKVGLIAALSVVIGALLAAGVVFLLETLDRRVRSRADLESRLAVPTLGRLSKWQPAGGRLLPSPSGAAARALPHPW